MVGGSFVRSVGLSVDWWGGRRSYGWSVSLSVSDSMGRLVGWSLGQLVEGQCLIIQPLYRPFSCSVGQSIQLSYCLIAFLAAIVCLHAHICSLLSSKNNDVSLIIK